MGPRPGRARRTRSPGGRAARLAARDPPVNVKRKSTPQVLNRSRKEHRMSRRMWIPLVMSALLVPYAAHAQPAEGQPAQAQQERGERGGDDRGDRGRGGDQAERRQRMEGFMKERLGVNDEEWKVLQPKIEKLMTARVDAGGGFGFMFDRRRDGDSEQQRSAVQTASRDLRTTLENKDASPDEIAAKHKARRDAREKAKTELAAAQKDLKEVLTQRQEAVLVTMGMLD